MSKVRPKNSQTHRQSSILKGQGQGGGKNTTNKGGYISGLTTGLEPCMHVGVQAVLLEGPNIRIML
jgi:hypothetical protein